MNETLEERLARSRAERLAREAEASVTSEDMTVFADHIPDVEYERTDEDKKLDTVIGAIDIVTGYKKWINKSQIPTSNVNRKEGIKVSCPVPGHRDLHPSAWLNTEKQVWFCAACDTGGDVYDLAAFYHGFPVPGYKTGATFHELRRAMAMDFGYVFTAVPGSRVPVLIAPKDGPDPEPVAAPPALSVVPDADTPVVEISEAPSYDDDVDLESLYGDSNHAQTYLDWHSIVPSGSFLDKYMQITTQDDVAEEFHFWNAMTALGFSLGRTTAAYDRIPVFGNLFICTIGDTGSGKSQARRHLVHLIDAAMKFDALDPMPKGVQIIQGVASAEVLIQSFDHTPSDPSIPKVFDTSIKGLVDFNEFSQLTGRSDRQGNVLKPTLLQFYDAEPLISTRSMTTKIKSARYPFASVHTTTQPKQISKLMSQGDADSGFLNRWFFASGVEKKRIAIGGKIIDVGPTVLPLQAIQRYYEGIGGTDHRNPNLLYWSDRALEEFSTFYYDVIEPVKKADESGMLSRLDLFYKKLALLFTANMMNSEINLDAVSQMIACHEYVLGCYGIPTKQLRRTTFTTIEDDIAGHLLRDRSSGKNYTTSGELMKALKRKGHQLDAVQRVLKVMVETGIINLDTSSTGKRGRPTVRYSLAV